MLLNLIRDIGDDKTIWLFHGFSQLWYSRMLSRSANITIYFGRTDIETDNDKTTPHDDSGKSVILLYQMHWTRTLFARGVLGFR